MSECPRCKERGKTWNGDDPVCAFQNGTFDSKNWNCATMNALRDLVVGDYTYNDDCYTALIPSLAGTILLSWYKRRGRTDGAWVVCCDRCKPMRLDEAEEALANNEPITPEFLAEALAEELANQ